MTESAVRNPSAPSSVDPGFASPLGQPASLPEGAPEVVPLNRETLAAGLLQQAARAHGGLRVLSEAELAQSLDQALADHPQPGADVWLFAYGSLIWNPAFHFAERRLARVHGWHRRFCLSTELGRGCPRAPGLVLALDAGGACRGVAYRVPAQEARRELPVVWRREMVTGSYRPRWSRLILEDGQARPGLLFTINRADRHYAPDLSDEDVARRLAVARGVLGTAADYLFSTQEALHAEGIHDQSLERIARRVRTLAAGDDAFGDPGPDAVRASGCGGD